jgi:8-oxo-dGTP diphosphatase
VPQQIEEFGIREPGADYRLRPGGYVVLRNDAGEVAVVETAKGLFLPGGGQDGEETPEQAALCETLEECGLIVRLTERIGVADELVLGKEERAHFRKRCTFFDALVGGADLDVDAEHEVTWLDPKEAVSRLAHGSQRWAVERSIGRGERP